MKRKVSFTLAMLLSTFLFCSTAFAGGWGPYFGWGTTSANVSFPDVIVTAAYSEFSAALTALNISLADVQALANEINTDVSFQNYSIGVMYDSAPVQDKLFNYRFTLAFDIASNLDLEGLAIPGLNTPIASIHLDESSKYGGSMTHTFGFSFVRTDILKWWIGPSIRICGNYWDEGVLKAGQLSLGGGGETGLNFHIGSLLSLCVSGGIHFNAVAVGGGTNEVGNLQWGYSPFYFIQTSVLFRTGSDRERLGGGDF